MIDHDLAGRRGEKRVRVLLLSYYFPPDLGAGAFRAQALVKALLANEDADVELDVVCSAPNRYQSYRPDSRTGQAQGYGLFSVPMASHQGGFVGQMRSFASYAKGVRSQVRGRQYDIVVASSSRLMTACLGAYCARLCNARLYLDIRDIFIETVADVFPAYLALPARTLLDRLERWTLAKADRVNLVSRGFLGYFQPRFPAAAYSFHSNGVDDVFLSAAAQAQEPKTLTARPLQVLYAGNIGEGQGLHLLLPALAERLRGQVEFTVVGDGNCRGLLESACEKGTAAVTFLDPVPRERLLELYRSADVLFLHLNNLPAFSRVLPSKLFEYAAMGKPIWAGLHGYSAEFVEANIDGVALFPSGDLDAAVESFRQLRVRSYDRQAFVAQFSRQRIMARMAEDIIGLRPLVDE